VDIFPYMTMTLATAIVLFWCTRNAKLGQGKPKDGLFRFRDVPDADFRFWRKRAARKSAPPIL